MVLHHYYFKFPFASQRRMNAKNASTNEIWKIGGGGYYNINE